MKKYHIADVLSFLEVVAAITILVGTVLGFKSEVILLLFGAGELCDAFDGAAARKWPYPDDGKRRFWRNPVFLKHYEWSKDIALGLITLAFIAVRIDLMTGVICGALALGLGSCMQIFAGSLWVWVHAESQSDKRREKAKADLEHYYVKRRIYVYVPAVVTLVLTLLYATSWPLVAKTIILFGLIMLGVYLWDFKADRRTSENADNIPRPAKLCLSILGVLMDPAVFNSAIANTQIRPRDGTMPEDDS